MPPPSDDQVSLFQLLGEHGAFDGAKVGLPSMGEDVGHRFVLARSMSSSMSTGCQSSRLANARARVVLPAAMKPTREILSAFTATDLGQANHRDAEPQRSTAKTAVRLVGLRRHDEVARPELVEQHRAFDRAEIRPRRVSRRCSATVWRSRCSISSSMSTARQSETPGERPRHRRLAGPHESDQVDLVRVHATSRSSVSKKPG